MTTLEQRQATYAKAADEMARAERNQMGAWRGAERAWRNLSISILLDNDPEQSAHWAQSWAFWHSRLMHTAIEYERAANAFSVAWVAFYYPPEVAE